MIDGVGYFPDAPTLRGDKHLKELAALQKEGYNCFITFVIQINGISRVLPNTQTHPEFSKALEEAKKAGVKVIFLECVVTENTLRFKAQKDLLV